MITPEYCRMMARYNAWQNGGIWAIVQDMSAAELDLDRGAFFGSIRATLNHLLWSDTLWLSRFETSPLPNQTIAESVDVTPTISAWWAERFRMDGHIRCWTEDIGQIDLTGDLIWMSVSLEREVHKPFAACVAHFFNHQTHHRGQVHAMLTAAGHRPDDTDLFIMPEDD